MRATATVTAVVSCAGRHAVCQRTALGAAL
jgi:hypothetical protein